MKQPTAVFWDERYRVEEFAYGVDANEFIVAYANHIIEGGRVLCLGAGEGRNAVFLAQQGFEVVAVDASAVGAKKTARLADERGVSVKTVTADLNDYEIGDGKWSAITSVFCHLPPPLRKRVHSRIPRGLVAGGVLLLEAYTPAQLGRGTGGPPQAELLYSGDELLSEFSGLDFVRAVELEREVHEGRYHHGMSSVVQLVGVKPTG